MSKARRRIVSRQKRSTLQFPARKEFTSGTRFKTNQWQPRNGQETSVLSLFPVSHFCPSGQNGSYVIKSKEMLLMVAESLRP